MTAKLNAIHVERRFFSRVILSGVSSRVSS
jgi:hypothetical protein